MGKRTYDRPQTISSSHVVLIDEAPKVAATHHTQYESRTKYINGTQHYLKITDRVGMNVVLPPAHTNGAHLTNTLEISRFYNTGTIVGTEALTVDPDGLRYNGKHSNIESDRVVAEALERAFRGTGDVDDRQWFGGKSDVCNFIGMKYIMSVDEFQRNKSRALYIEELDVIVSIFDPHNNVNYKHPAARQGNVLRSDVSNVVSFSMHVEINDPNNEFGGRYMKAGERVIEIAPTKDLGKKPGIYVSYLNDADSSNSCDATYYRFGDASELTYLYKFKEGARTHGVDSSELKAARDHLKHKHDMEASIRADILMQLKHERDRDMIYEKVRHERSSAATKFFSDIPKWIIPVCSAITAIGSLITVFMKKS